MLLRANVNRLFWEAVLAFPEGVSLSNDDADGEIPADGAANYATMCKAAEGGLLRYVWNFPPVSLPTNWAGSVLDQAAYRLKSHQQVVDLCGHNDRRELCVFQIRVGRID